MQVISIPGGAFQGDPIQELFNLSIDMSALNVSSSVNLKLNQDRFSKMQINHAISAVNGSKLDLACSLFPIESFFIESLTTNAAFDVISFYPDGKNIDILEKDLDIMINNFLRLFLKEYKELATLSFSGFLDGPVRKIATNTVIDQFQKIVKNYDISEDLCLALSGNLSKSDYIDFSDFSLLTRLNNFLNNAETKKEMNNFIECLSQVFTSQVGSASPNFAFNEGVIDLSGLEIENFGTVQNIDVFLPKPDYRLLNSFKLGKCTGKTNGSDEFIKCIGPSVTLEIDSILKMVNMSGKLSLTAYVGAFESAISTFILYDFNKLRNLTYAHLLSRNGCIFSPVEESAIIKLPQIISKLFFGLDARIDADGEQLEFYLNSSNYSNSISILKSTSSWFQTSLVEYTNRKLSGLILTGEKLCHGTSQEGTKKPEVAREVLFILVYLLPLYILLHIIYVGFDTKKLPRRLRNEATERLSITLTGNALCGNGSSLMKKEVITNEMKHIFPIVVIVTVALLISSNLCTGATVDLTISANSTNIIELPSLFTFSLAETTSQMYHARTYALLFFVAIFSGIWPYMKLLLMLWAWFAPESWLHEKKRGKLLFIIDGLSKFSLVDTYVLIIMMVSFRFHLPLLGKSILFDVFVDPAYGFYSFLAATILSLIAGHFELNMQRKNELLEQESKHEPIESLFTHKYCLNGKSLKFSKLFKFTVVGFVTLIIILLSIGSMLKSFTFEFGGLAGVLLDERRQNYSLISIGNSIPQSVRYPNSLGNISLQLAYFFFACITPLICLILLLVLLLIPMKRKTQKILLTATEVANAWGGIEVFALSIIVALFELSTFASFIVGTKCDIVNQIIADQFSILVHGENTCFSVSAHISWSVSFLVIGAILNSFVVSSLLLIAQVVIEERFKIENNMDKSVTEETIHYNIIHSLEACFLGPLFFVTIDKSDEGQ